MTTVAIKINLNLHVATQKINTRCQWRGGNLAKDEDGLTCIQCDRPHDMNGNLIQRMIGKRR